jgi:putative chitinase
MTIHREYFFDSIRASLAGGSLTQDQVDGCTVFLDWYDRENPPLPERYHVDDRMLAYILATTWHETAFTMQPIEEYGKGKGMKYGVPAGPYGQIYYGRGYVQLTWYENYKRQDEKLGLLTALEKDPDLALDPVVAKEIIIKGMVDGDFTGKKLGDFFTATLTDWYEARTIVNAHDQATTIAKYAEAFCNAITHM